MLQNQTSADDSNTSSSSLAVQLPDRDFLFIEDIDKEKKPKEERKRLRQRQKDIEAARKKGSSLPFDINAPNINFDSAGNKVKASGGVTATYGSALLESQEGTFDLSTKDADVSGKVHITDVETDAKADHMTLNLGSGVATMDNAEITLEDGNYRLNAVEAKHLGNQVFHLDDSTLTTCECPEGESCSPWSIHSDSADIVREGYAKVHGATLRVNDVPVFYSPYLIFPVKTERQTGLLPFSFGGGRSGLKLRVPFFWNIDNSTDLTVTGGVQTQARVGIEPELRKVFSRQSRLKVGLLYYDETLRKGDLQGTNLEGLADPTIDEDRLGAYLNDVANSEILGQPVQMVLDGGYVSDDLIVREIDDGERIADRESRFVTSRGVIRTPLVDTYSLSLSSEYSQALVTEDSLVFQRLPELALNGFTTYRPFGTNPYGFKLTQTDDLDAVNFTREQGYQGARAEAYERLKSSFHISNYVDISAVGGVRATQYQLDDTENPDDPEMDLRKDTNRFVPSFQVDTSTVLEKVFPVSQDSLIKEITDLGPLSREQQLVRLKHTIQPTVKYLQVPEVDQRDNPLFDSIDHLAQKSVVTYGVRQSLYGRFEPRDQNLVGIEETTPELGDLPPLGNTAPLDEKLSFGIDQGSGTYQGMSSGSVQELARFDVSQSYDALEAGKSRDINQSALSDVNANLSLLPNYHVRFNTGTDFSVDNNDFSSYYVEGQLLDKRRDELRTRLRFVDSVQDVRQLESSLQVLLTERLKIGYYSRYDDILGEFVENRVGLRLNSSCNCWIADLDVSDKINPNETSLLFNVTLVGIGDIGNTIFTSFADKNKSSN